MGDSAVCEATKIQSGSGNAAQQQKVAKVKVKWREFT
jgi:hypothetical protein